MTRKPLRLWPLLLLPALAACRRVERAAPPGKPDRVVAVVRGGQVRDGDLKIGLGYVRRGAPAEVGGARRSLTAGLWFYVRGRSSENKAVAARAGQTLTVAGRRVFVAEVRSGRDASVTLDLYGAPAAP